VNRNQTTQLDSGILAALQQVGGGWRMLILAARNGRSSVLEAGEYPAGRIGEIEARLTAARAGRVICILPAASAVCRTVTLPNAEPEQLQQALQLQAETHLPADAAPYRTAMTVLPPAPGETSRTGVLLFWPPTAMVAAPPVGGRPIRYAPAVTALVELLDGLRPADPLMWLDRADGSFALAISHASGAVFRAARETASSSDDWTRRITAALAETALNSGHTGAFVDSLVQSQTAVIESVEADGAALIAPPEIIDAACRRLEGVRADPTWWRRYGVLAGAALAATGALAPLTNMLDAPAVEKPSVFARAGQALSQPRTAFITAVICLLVLALTPVAASGLRLGFLKLRYPDIAERERAIEQKRRQLAMYSALEEQAWCASKLLSDIVCNTPEGIELEKIDLDRDKLTFTVRGLARPHAELSSAQEVIAVMQEQLDHSGIFTSTRFTLDDPNAYGHYQFDLTAEIAHPHRRERYEPGGVLDFANWTLADRQRGEGPRIASGTVPATGESDTDAKQVAVADEDDGEFPEAATGGSSRERLRPPPEGVITHQERGGDDIPERMTPPAPLTEAQINAMTIDEVKAYLPRIATARNHARGGADEELKERLQKEFQLLMTRLQELQGSS
jgi:hypothetical protein